MLDSASQWNLLADCAKDWGFCSDAADSREKNETAPQHGPKPQFSLQDIAQLQTEYMESSQTENDGSVHAAMTDLVHVCGLSSQEEQALLHDLMANPKNAVLWQLCLMGYSKENISRFENSLQSPLEGVETWLLEGIRKGWLRRLEKKYSVNFLAYPLFVHRLQRDCEGAGRPFCVSIVKIQASDFVHDLCMQSFAKHLSEEDYLCKINDLGYAVVLAGRKNFSACAVMEKAADELERFLHREQLELSFSAGVSEFCQADTAETLLDHAKQALSLPSPCGIKVKSFVREKNLSENNSLVQSDEKRFLFFGMQ